MSPMPCPPTRCLATWIVGILAAATIGGAVLVITWPQGAGVSGDSAAYLTTAESLAAGRGALDWRGNPRTYQPPGYPLALAGWMVLGIEGARAAGLVNVLCIVTLVGVSAAWLAHRVRSVPLRILGIAVVALGVPVFEAATRGLSELMFAVIVAACLYATDRYRAKPSATRAAALGGIVAAAIMTRYIGVVLVGVVGATLLVTHGRDWRTWLKRGGLFAIIPGVSLGAWMYRNLAADGTLMGARRSSLVGVAEAVGLTLSTVESWIKPQSLLQRSLPGMHVGGAEEVVFWAVVAAGAIVTILRVKRSLGVGPSRAATWPVSPAPLAVILFLGMMVYSACRVAFDPLGTRLLMPVYVPMVWSGVLLLDRALLTASGPWRRGLTIALCAAGVVWLAGYPARVTAATALSRYRNGPVGINSSDWANSPLIDRIRRIELPATVLSNRNSAIMYHTSASPEWSPRKHYRLSTARPAQPFEAVAQGLRAGRGVWLVWFYGDPGGFFPPTELQPYLRMEKVFDAPRGELYRVTALKPAAASRPAGP